MLRKLTKGRKPVLSVLFLSIIMVAATVPSSVAVTWSVNETRLTTYRNFDGIPSITQTRDGRIWIAWTRVKKGNCSIVYQTSSNWGASWSQETILTADASADTSPSIFQAMDGTVWVVWSSDRTGGYELYYKTSSDDGLTWSNATRLTTNPGYDLSPAATQTADGTVWVVWSSDRTGGFDLYYKTSSDDGLTWSNATRLTTNSSLDKLPSIAQTSDGNVWISWCSNQPGDYEIFYMTYNGFSWSSETRLTTDPKTDMDPEVLQTLGGTILVFWSSRPAPDLPSSTDDLYYMYSSDNGVTWSDRIQLTTDNCEDTWPTATQTSDTKVWVAWTSDRSDQPDGNWDIYYKTSLAGDVNGDGVIDVYDLSAVGQAYGSVVGETEYNPDADFNKDNLVDMRDIAIISRNWGST